jgi:hypothetical protein
MNGARADGETAGGEQVGAHHNNRRSTAWRHFSGKQQRGGAEANRSGCSTCRCRCQICIPVLLLLIPPLLLRTNILLCLLLLPLLLLLLLLLPKLLLPNTLTNLSGPLGGCPGSQAMRSSRSRLPPSLTPTIVTIDRHSCSCQPLGGGRAGAEETQAVRVPFNWST